MFEFCFLGGEVKEGHPINGFCFGGAGLFCFGGERRREGHSSEPGYEGGAFLSLFGSVVFSKHGVQARCLDLGGKRGVCYLFNGATGELFICLTNT